MFTKEQLLSIIPEAQKRRFESVEEKKKKVIQNALANYAKGCQREDIVAIYDVTILCNGKKGFLLATDALYGYEFAEFKSDTSGVTKIPFQGLKTYYCYIDSMDEAERKCSIANSLYRFLYEDGTSVSVYLSTVYGTEVLPIINGILGLINLEKEDIISEEITQESTEGECKEAIKDSAQVVEEENVEQEDSSAVQSSDSADNRIVPMKKFEDLQTSEEFLTWYQQYQLGKELFEKAVDACEKECYAEAFAFFEKAAILGFEAAMYNCGVMCEQGEGVEADMTKAIFWYQKAAEEGSIEAKFHLETWDKAKKAAELLGQPEQTEVYYKGSNHLMKQGRESFFEGDYKKAFVLLELAERTGFYDAYFLLGRMYAEGLGIEKNLEKAKKLFGKLQKKPIGERYRISFGRYQQEPIFWWVLDRKEDAVLLLSAFVIDLKKYHGNFTAVTWENCDLRKWLNKDFFKTAFTEYEQEHLIRKVQLENNGNLDYSTKGCAVTEDKIFLLSIEEAKKYLAEEMPKRITTGDASGYGLAKAFYAYKMDDSVSEGIPTERVFYEKGNDLEDVRWWLRSPGVNQKFAVCDWKYEIELYGSGVDDREGVRPAVWITLPS